MAAVKHHSLLDKVHPGLHSSRPLETGLRSSVTATVLPRQAKRQLVLQRLLTCALCKPTLVEMLTKRADEDLDHNAVIELFLTLA